VPIVSINWVTFAQIWCNQWGDHWSWHPCIRNQFSVGFFPCVNPKVQHISSFTVTQKVKLYSKLVPFLLLCTIQSLAFLWKVLNFHQHRDLEKELSYAEIYRKLLKMICLFEIRLLLVVYYKKWRILRI
jgi:hypothetical protein